MVANFNHLRSSGCITRSIYGIDRNRNTTYLRAIDTYRRIGNRNQVACSAVVRDVLHHIGQADQSNTVCIQVLRRYSRLNRNYRSNRIYYSNRYLACANITSKIYNTYVHHLSSGNISAVERRIAQDNRSYAAVVCHVGDQRA